MLLQSFLYALSVDGLGLDESTQLVADICSGVYCMVLHALYIGTHETW